LYYKPPGGSQYLKIDGTQDKANLLVAINDQFLKADANEKNDSLRIYPLEKLSPLVPDIVPYNYSTKVNIGKLSGLKLPHYMRLAYNNFEEYISDSAGNLGLYKQKEMASKYGTSETALIAGNAAMTKNDVFKDGGNDFVIGSVGHWYAAYTLPTTTVAVPRGENPNTNPSSVLRNGYISVSFNIMTKKDDSSYLIYTGPKAEYDPDGTTPEQVLIEWNFVAGGSEEGGGYTKGNKRASKAPDGNPAIALVNEDGQGSEKRTVAATGATNDRYYNDSNNAYLLKKGSTYLNKNVILKSELQSLENVADVNGRKQVITNAEELYKAGYYERVFMPDGSYTYLPTNTVGTNETDNTAQRDVGIGISY
jgi:hypothetical protein